MRQLQSVCQRLEEVGFVRPAPSGGRLPAAVRPASAIRNLIHLRKAEILRTSSELETLTASVDRLAAQMLGRATRAETVGIETVRGHAAIAERVASLLASATHQVNLLAGYRSAGRGRRPHAVHEGRAVNAPGRDYAGTEPAAATSERARQS